MGKVPLGIVYKRINPFSPVNAFCGITVIESNFSETDASSNYLLLLTLALVNEEELGWLAWG